MGESKKKVLMFVDRMRVGGIQILLLEIYKHMDQSDLTLEFLVLDDGEDYSLEDEIVSLGATVHKLKGIWLRKLGSYKSYCIAMDSFFKEHHDYVAVHMHSGSKNFFVMYYAKKYGITIRIAHSHNTHFQSKSKLQIIVGNVMKLPLKKYATHYFACSEDAGSWLFGKRSVKKRMVTVLKNAVDLDAFEYKKEVRDSIRADLGVEEGTIVIGNVGRFTVQKNHSFLIEIFYQINKVNKNCILILAGIGELMEECKEQVKKFGIENKVYFLGFRPDVKDLLQGMDVFLMPSLYEGFPVTGIEAQASGLPCVFSDTITREAQIIEAVRYVGLTDKVTEWADKTLELATISDRNASKFLLKQQGFDIKEYTQNLKTFYMGI